MEPQAIPSLVTANDIYGVLPLLILAATGLVVLMVDAFEKRPSRTPLFLAVIGAAGAAISAFLNVDNTGRVFNATSGTFLNNARVRVEGTNIEAYTNSNGEYSLRAVPEAAMPWRSLRPMTLPLPGPPIVLPDERRVPG